jgi:hypothetical protein
MAGDRLARLASLLLRHETFTLIVEPAIADLQHGKVTGVSSVARMRLWIGVVRAISAAVVVETARDLYGAAAAVAAAAPDRTVAGTLVAIVGASVLMPRVIYPDLWSSAPMMTQAVLLMFVLPSAIANGLFVSLVPLGRRLARQDAFATRLFPALLLLLTTVLFAYLDRAVVPANAAFRTFGINAAAEVQHTTFSEQLRFERHATGGARRRTLAGAASAGAFLMLGIAMRRRGPATTVVVAVAAGFVYGLTQSTTLGSVLREWVPAAVAYAIAAAALTVSRCQPAAPA